MTIQSATEGDAGIYTCQIKGGDGKQIKHTVCIGKCEIPTSTPLPPTKISTTNPFTPTTKTTPADANSGAAFTSYQSLLFGLFVSLLVTTAEILA